ncbi:MAG: cytidine deaminase [Myxococcaceae bacterium]|nr:cytidine deaminase [Myxococcaceae bacterium]MBH2006277.1 cytidine deaminase [Myxococcaceae bacterium]
MLPTKKLIAQAQEAREKAYAPYSHYRVGAALLLDNGSIIQGVNVENASYGATLCAERSAVASAVSQGFQTFKAIAIVTDSPHPAAPCGLCRQVLAEFAPTLPILLANIQGDVLETNLETLLPMQFTLK